MLYVQNKRHTNWGQYLKHVDSLESKTYLIMAMMLCFFIATQVICHLMIRYLNRFTNTRNWYLNIALVLSSLITLMICESAKKQFSQSTFGSIVGQKFFRCLTLVIVECHSLSRVQTWDTLLFPSPIELFVDGLQSDRQIRTFSLSERLSIAW